MDKKKTNPKTSQAPEELMPARYVRQPYPITAMQANLSIQQIRILAGMMKSVQEGVQDMFERKERDPNGQLLLFPEQADDRIHIDFKFSDVVDRPDAYRDVEKIANKFMQMVFRYEDKERGEIKLKHFVYEITYPKRGSKRDRIRFTFTREQAETVFNFTMYSRYLFSVIFYASNKYTARLYMLITSARGFDKEGTGIFHWYVAYEELRRILGCDDKDEAGHWYRKSQKLYKHFKADILKAAERELRQLADEGKSDCWFEFVELPEGFTGEPERFDFITHLSRTGQLEYERVRSNAAAMKLVGYMQETFGMKESKALELTSSVDAANMGTFSEEVHKLAERIDKKSKSINVLQSYAETSIKDIIGKMKPAAPAEELSPKGAEGSVNPQFIAALRAATNKADQYLDQRLSELELDTATKTIRLKGSPIDAFVEWYWTPEKFNEILAEHLPGYSFAVQN